MTAVLQITDTDVAFRMKASCRRWGDELRRELRAKAAAQKVRSTFKTVAFEMMWILSKAQSEIEHQCLETDFVLQAARRNHLLAWRPRLAENKFVEAEEEGWASEFPAGSHRIDKGWAADRLKWLLPSGKAPAPDWSLQDKAASEADLEEISYIESEKLQMSRYFTSVNKTFACQEMEIECEEVDEDLMSSEAKLLQLSPAVRRFNAESQASLTDQQGIPEQ
jgi:hypothetical protein